jgi:hypothetical protein
MTVSRSPPIPKFNDKWRKIERLLKPLTRGPKITKELRREVSAPSLGTWLKIAALRESPPRRR